VDCASFFQLNLQFDYAFSTCDLLHFTILAVEKKKINTTFGLVPCIVIKITDPLNGKQFWHVINYYCLHSHYSLIHVKVLISYD
jgi:hypothetical protein